jgi:hypothetical protein
MKRILLTLAALAILVLARLVHAQPAAPSSCPKSPCATVTWNESGAAITRPGMATIAVCVGSAAACGANPGKRGPNRWIQYTVRENTPAGSGIVPGLAYGQVVQIVVNFAYPKGKPSAWSAPLQLQVGRASHQK